MKQTLVAFNTSTYIEPYLVYSNRDTLYWKKTDMLPTIALQTV